MPDAVCSCGTYVRAYVPAGTRINCPQCGVLLTMGGDPGGSEGSESGQESGNQARKRSKKAKRLRIVLFSALGMATVVCGLAYGWWSNRSDYRVDKEERKAVVGSTPELSIPSPLSTKPPEKNPAYWTVDAAWTQSDDQESRQDIRSLAERITKAGESMNSHLFWDEVLMQTAEKQSSKNDQYLTQIKSSPLDFYSTFQNTVGSDWFVVGIHQDPKSLGVLIRYYYEPLGSYVAATESSEWISQSKKLLSIDEFTQSTGDVFTEQSSSENNEPSLFENPNASNQPPLLFAPRFGYLVLLLEPLANGASLRDIVSVPGEVSAIRFEDEAKPKIHDVFGIYQFDSDRSLARLLLLGREQDSANGASESRKEIGSIEPLRVKRLAEIAETALHEPYSTDDRIKRFRREFPNDFGADALLVSIWMTHYQTKRMTFSFDDFGRVFIEAAHRLFMRTNDPLLLEVKSRIYLAFAKLNDSEKCLDEAQAAKFESVHLLQRRIEEASNRKDKEKLMNSLRQLNELVRQKPEVISNRNLKSAWNKQWLDWRAESQAK